MKKTIKKKLILKKRTISNLSYEEKKKIRGGKSFLIDTCYCNTEHESCSLKINCCPPPEKADNDTLYYC